METWYTGYSLTTELELIIPINDAHSFGEWASNGDGAHSRICANNAEHKETVACSGGTATCTEKAICSTCNTDYGQANGHSYSEATCTQKATCSVCGDEKGELAEHVDGNADGKCDACQYQMTPEPEQTTPEPEESTPAPEESSRRRWVRGDINF